MEELKVGDGQVAKKGKMVKWCNVLQWEIQIMSTCPCNINIFLENQISVYDFLNLA